MNSILIFFMVNKKNTEHFFYVLAHIYIYIYNLDSKINVILLVGVFEINLEKCPCDAYQFFQNFW